jgi:hypothetical protein
LASFGQGSALTRHKHLLPSFNALQPVPREKTCSLPPAVRHETGVHGRTPLSNWLWLVQINIFRTIIVNDALRFNWSVVANGFVNAFIESAMQAKIADGVRKLHATRERQIVGIARPIQLIDTADHRVNELVVSVVHSLEWIEAYMAPPRLELEDLTQVALKNERWLTQDQKGAIRFLMKMNGVKGCHL